MLLQGGLNPKLPLQYYIDLVRETRRQFPQIHPHFFSAPEIMKMVQVSGLTVREVLVELQTAGLTSIPGGGSEILSNKVKRKISRLFPKGNVDDWTIVHREAHQLGYRTTATMMYGHLEEDEDVIEHLEHLRLLQDETRGFIAFIPWSYKAENTALARRVSRLAGPNCYLRMIALSPNLSGQLPARPGILVLRKVRRRARSPCTLGATTLAAPSTRRTSCRRRASTTAPPSRKSPTSFETPALPRPNALPSTRFYSSIDTTYNPTMSIGGSRGIIPRS